ncbi:hypothetical protein F4779DRAFT_562855 [Xylariaceae sp. FL0662B]|nr:hypothetical protein F4779DRAFT_562855 [Xylariaceae sp. FL0662B]
MDLALISCPRGSTDLASPFMLGISMYSRHYVVVVIILLVQHAGVVIVFFYYVVESYILYISASSFVTWLFQSIFLLYEVASMLTDRYWLNTMFRILPPFTELCTRDHRVSCFPEKL